MPTVPVHDLVIHPREGDLIAATHGRSLWILDDITPLQQLRRRLSNQNLFVSEQSRDGLERNQPRRHARPSHVSGPESLDDSQQAPANSPSELANSATISFYLKNAPTEPVQMEISSMDGARTLSAERARDRRHQPLLLGHAFRGRWRYRRTRRAGRRTRRRRARAIRTRSRSRL